MIKKIHNLIVGSIIIFFSSFSLADDHTQNYFVETIPMSLIGESNLEDLLNTGKPFRNWMENGGTNYSVYLMVPWAVDKSAAGSQTDWDVIWAGFSPTVQDYSKTMEYYLNNGDEIDSIYNGMRSFDTRSMAMGRTIFQGTEPSGETGVALFRTCSLNKNKTIENAESAMKAMASALKRRPASGMQPEAASESYPGRRNDRKRPVAVGVGWQGFSCATDLFPCTNAYLRRRAGQPCRVPL